MASPQDKKTELTVLNPENLDPRLKKMMDAQLKRLQDQFKILEKNLKKGRPFGLVPMATVLKPVRSGNVWVDHFELNEDQVFVVNLKAANEGHPEQGMASGVYCKLIVDGKVMMSDVPFETLTNADVIQKSRGNVLIAGLGMGMILIPIIRNPKVKRVIVVERNPDVVKCVLPQLLMYLEDEAAKKLSVVEMDILHFVPRARLKFDVIYFDIWPSVDSDNWPMMRGLHARFRKFLKARGWISSWMVDTCRNRWSLVRRRKKISDAAVGGDPLRPLIGSGKDFKVDEDPYAGEMKCERIEMLREGIPTIE